MSQLDLFIFSSDRTGAHRIRTAVVLAIWILLGLITIDVLINVLFPYPSNPRNLHPSFLQLYFDYGRSQEGKLRRMTRADKSKTAPITLAGWYEPLEITEPPKGTNRTIVTFYGMSHAVRLARAFGRLSKQFTPRIIGAPGATANWAYGAYLRDRGGGVSQAVVLAFMSGNLAMINTMTAMTWNTGIAMPYTADRFLLAKGGLKVVHPPYDSFAAYVHTLNNIELWSKALRRFKKYDSIYDSFVIRENTLDHSALFRLLRRAYTERMLRDANHAVLDHTGFVPSSNQVQVAQKIVQEFARDARKNGMIPVIYIVNLLGDFGLFVSRLKTGAGAR